MPVNPDRKIYLAKGYQFTAFLPTHPINAQTAFSDILDNIDYAKDSKSNILRKIGPTWVNNIGDLKPGQGYLLKMKVDDILQYPTNSKLKRNTRNDNIEIPTHFGEVNGNPADPAWTIYLAKATIKEQDLAPGDEIAIFDGEKLVGAFKLNETLTDDGKFDNVLKALSTLNEGDGYEPGGRYTFKCWDASKRIEHSNFEIVLNNPYNDAYTGEVFP
ncbi:MAG: hypothetical protein OMM_10075, partial [Candidatus Magnetoglobus multicellularis str. Araruama]